jgi:seryl-tRNA synthetase
VCSLSLTHTHTHTHTLFSLPFPGPGSAGSATRGLYRVHQFTKVELFAITAGDVATSCAMMDEIVALQVEMFTELGLHFKVLDMATHDLGAPAYRKFDVEAWMPGRKSYGEISSTSNCTDFQSRRLNIKYRDKLTSQNQFVHTVTSRVQRG